MKNNFYALVLMLATLVLPVSVSADGEATESGGFGTTTRQVCRTETTAYGGTTTVCHDEIREQVLREKGDEPLPDTGLIESMFVVTALVAGGMGLFALAQRQLNG